MHLRVGIQPLDDVQQFRLGNLSGEAMLKGAHAGLHGLPRLVAHIDLARRVVTHQHHGKARLERQRRHLGGDFRHQFRRERLAVDQFCRHVFAPFRN